MKLHKNADLIDRLAASYALGTLRGGARRRLETIASEKAAVRAKIQSWQTRCSHLTEVQTPLQPSDNVWKLISNQLPAHTTKEMTSPLVATLQDQLFGLTQRLRWWKQWAFAGMFGSVLAGVLAVFVGVGIYTPASNTIEYVAVLSDDQSKASVLVTFNVQSKKLTLKQVGGYQTAADKSLQLWALSAQGPQSLGVLDAMDADKVTNKGIQLTAAASQVSSVPALAISLEPKGGVPSSGGPTGPVLFKGALLKTAF